MKSPSPVLETVARALTDEGFAITLFDMRDDKAPDPLKRWFWERWRRPSWLAREHVQEVGRLEAEIARLRAGVGEEIK